MIKLDEFISEIEVTFSNYAETGDIDKISIKSWVINCLRRLGNNICDLRETIVDIENSRGLLPETFDSLKLALKIEGDKERERHKEYNSVIHKQWIEKPVVWDSIMQEYIYTGCETKVITERLFSNRHPIKDYEHVEFLQLMKGIKKDVLSVDCINLNPAIRGISKNSISITNRTINTSFNEGKIYIQYNSLPSDEDNEIAIPIFTTGDISLYIENYVKMKIAENLIINSKNPQGVSTLLNMWKQENRLLEVRARSEAMYNGLPNDWYKKVAEKNKANRPKLNLR